MSDLELERDFAHAPEKVWDAWTDPTRVVKWLGPVDWPAVRVDNDVRVGGQWRACLEHDSGEQLWQSGRYLVVDRPRRLEMTFQWEGSNHEDGAGVPTHITVVLEPIPTGTRMRFAQKGLASAKSRDGHTHGWSSSFDRLERELSS